MRRASKSVKSKRNPVSAAEADYFEQMVLKWQALLNLRDWRIVRLEDRHPTMMAEVQSMEFEHKLAKYKIGAFFGSHRVTPESLEATALHEVLHIFLASLIYTCFSEGEQSHLVDEIEHGVIIVLEGVLMNRYSEGALHGNKGR